MNSNFFNICCVDVKKSWSVLLFAAFFALAGCGGGGSSSASTENELPSPLPGGIDGEDPIPGPDGQDPATPDELALLPTISVGQRQFADPNVLLTLSATAEAAEGAQIARTLWTQVAGPTVRIPSPLALSNLILMPDVNVATQLEFRFIAEDSEGRVNSATVSVLVKPVPTFVSVVGGVFNEADGEAIFTVRLNAPSELPVVVTYITQDGSATSESDYVFSYGEITFEPGEVVKEIAVTLIDDTIVEEDETFSLRVTAINGEMTHANVGIVIIRNGTEPQLEQVLQFSDAGPVTIFIDAEYINPLNPNVPAPGTGDVIYSSSDTSIATVDVSGLVVGVGLGTAEITATKLADDMYLSASASYTLQVVSRGATPTVGIEALGIESSDEGEYAYFYGFASDEEDGSLPTEAERLEFEENGTPITSVSWSSNIDGFLGYGDYLEYFEPLTVGNHIITYSVTDSDGNVGSFSSTLSVGNVAPLAFAVADTTYCPSENDGLNCYYPYRVNDGDTDTTLGGWTSWVNNNGTLLPQAVTLSWFSPVTIRGVDLYTSQAYEMRDYDVEYLNDMNEWIVVASVVNNTETYRSHVIPEVTTMQLRVVAKLGSVIQSTLARINEIVVFGTGGQSSSPMSLPDMSSSAESSSEISSPEISSSAMSSSEMSSFSSGF